MIRPVEMEKIMLVAVKNAESPLISTLHKAGMIEIVSSELPNLTKGKPLEIHNEVSKELIRIRSLINTFQSLPFIQKSVEQTEIAELEYESALIQASAIKIDDELRQLIDSRGNLVSQLAEIEKKRAEIASISYFRDIDFSKLNTKNFTFTIGKISPSVFRGFKKDLEEYLNKEVEILYAPVKKLNVHVLVFYPRKENIEFILSRYNFEKISLPENFSYFEKGMEDLENVTEQTKKAIASDEAKIALIASKHLAALIKLEKELAILSVRAAISTKFSSSNRLVLVEGWIKKRDMNILGSMLTQKFPGQTELIKLPGQENAPIALDNPKSINQFQWLVEFYSLPRYTEFDPTFILLFTVPITYGMILGDVGYGIISIFLSLLILRKYKTGMLGNIANIWLFSSFAAIIFGIIFDEWFGLTHLHLLEWLNGWGMHTGIEHPIYAGITRSHNLSLVIGLTLFVGVVQLSLGFILGAINAWHHNKKHAIAKIMWLTVLLSGSVATSSFVFNLLPADMGSIAGVVFVISSALIIYLEGIVGLFEIPGLAANTFSYARIAAAGVAGVVLAEIINEAFLPDPTKSILLFPIFVLLHILNAGLAMFEAIVQGGRLNLVEFYSKFFHGGGKAFEPFCFSIGKKNI